MIGREIIFKKIAKSGKQIIGITFVQSIGTFLFATALAPALSIVNEYHTNGPITKTLIPLAAIDDIFGVIVFFTVISVISGVNGTTSIAPSTIIAIVLLPFVIGIIIGLLTSFLMKKANNRVLRFALMLIFLCLSTLCSLFIDINIFHSFSLNYLLIGMAFSATIANVLTEEELRETLKLLQ